MRLIKTTIIAFVFFTLLCGLAYPLLMTFIAQAVFGHRANGSIVYQDGKAIGSELIGQEFTKPWYFHGRPSAVAYDASESGGSNAPIFSKEYLALIKERTAQARKDYNIKPDEAIPSDLITASGSGLDPHISLESAILQVKAVAKARGTDPQELSKLVMRNFEREVLEFGSERVNVLFLNIELDDEYPMKR